VLVGAEFTESDESKAGDELEAEWQLAEVVVLPAATKVQHAIQSCTEVC
jgi:hypothetical protein